MEVRRRILKCLLASLALAAIAGVAAVLLPGRDVMLKVMFTGLITAVAAGILVAFSFMITRRGPRPGGLFGMVAVLVEFVTALSLIWLTPFLSNRTEEKLAITLGAIALTALPAVGYLALVRRERLRLAAAAGTGSAAAALLIFLVATWLAGGGGSRAGWWGTGWTVLGYGVLIFACLAGIRPRVRDLWRWGGAAAIGIGAGALIALIWQDVRGLGPSRPLENAIAIFTSLGALAGLAALTLLPDLRGGQRWVRVATIAAAGATAVFIDLIVLADGALDDELFARLTAASGIVTGCGSLAIIVLATLNRRASFEPSTETPVELVVVCPVCTTKQSVPVGVSACRGCGLKFSIKLEEPRCPACQYLLYRLTSDRCPECGAAVRTDRTAADVAS